MRRTLAFNGHSRIPSPQELAGRAKGTQDVLHKDTQQRQTTEAPAALPPGLGSQSLRNALSSKKGLLRTLIYTISVVIVILGLSYVFVPFYQFFCQTSGFGGTVQELGNAPIGSTKLGLLGRQDGEKGGEDAPTQVPLAPKDGGAQGEGAVLGHTQLPMAPRYQPVTIRFNADTNENIP
jgi:hypothetical protein